MKTKQKILYVACLSFLFVCSFILVACKNNAEITSFDVKLNESYNIVDNTITVSYGENYYTSLEDLEIVATFDDKTTKTINYESASNNGFTIETTIPNQNFTPTGNYTITIKHECITEVKTINFVVTNTTFNVTLISNGSEFDSISVDGGNPINLPTPSKDYHTFYGWFDENFENEFTSSSVVNSNLTLYAKFTAISHTISYENLNGESNSNPQTYLVKDGLTLTNLNNKLDYNFDGWYTDSNLTNRIEEIAVGQTENFTLYAKWVQKDEFKPFTYIINSNNQTITITGVSAVDKSIVTSLTIPNITTSINSQAFKNCTNLESVTIPDSVTSIGAEAFRCCESLVSVTIPNGVSSINDYTFKDCKELKTVVLGTGVSYIGDEAFANCSKLESLLIKGTLSSASKNIFLSTDISFVGGSTNTENINLILNTNQKELQLSNSGFYTETATTHTSKTQFCGLTFKSISHAIDVSNATVDNLQSKLTGVDFSKPVSIIFPENANSDLLAKFKSIISQLPDGSLDLEIMGIKNIPEQSLMNCNKFKTIHFGNGVTTIGRQTFYGCERLTSVTFGDSVRTLEFGAFKNCSALTEVSIPDTITTLSNSSFHSCTSLTTAKIGKGVTTLYTGLFGDCYNLRTVIFNKSVTKIEEQAFTGCSVSAYYFEGSQDEWNAITGIRYATNGTVYFYSTSPISGANTWYYNENGNPTIHQ